MPQEGAQTALLILCCWHCLNRKFRIRRQHRGRSQCDTAATKQRDSNYATTCKPYLNGLLSIHAPVEKCQNAWLTVAVSPKTPGGYHAASSIGPPACVFAERSFAGLTWPARLC
mmetsp:Transcript_60703/g.120268  ORF Transcript_60703/g.120268 Transcript_60703/m.120268 type:complete len:114 (-) Transcript_60703:606-947(-)